jgi:hypothetical protein
MLRVVNLNIQKTGFDMFVVCICCKNLNMKSYQKKGLFDSPLHPLLFAYFSIIDRNMGSSSFYTR